MPQITDTNFVVEKNQQENVPIMLYEVTIDDTHELDIAEWDVNVVYPTSGGKTYLPFPITHESIPMNISGEIDACKVTVGNANQIIGGYLLANDGLRGNKVVMKLVFADLLADADAHLDNEFYIDGVIISETQAVFTLTSKLDLMQVQIPLRSFIRDFCPWPYKQDGCWLLSGGVYSAPSGFANTAIQCDKTLKGARGCAFHNNMLRFGGWPTMPARRIYVI